MQTFEHGGSLRTDKRNDREEGEGVCWPSRPWQARRTGSYGYVVFAIQRRSRPTREILGLHICSLMA